MIGALLASGFGFSLGVVVVLLWKLKARRDELAFEYLRGFAAGRKSERADAERELVFYTHGDGTKERPWQRELHEIHCSTFRTGECDCVVSIRAHRERYERMKGVRHGG